MSSIRQFGVFCLKGGIIGNRETIKCDSEGISEDILK